MPLRVAVIGAGAFGRNHIRVVSQMQGVELSAVVDSDPEKFAGLELSPAVHRLTSLDHLPDGIDAALLVTPTNTHEELATRLLQSGIDVLVEKPIADSSAAGARLGRIAETSGRILQVGHLERFNPAVTALNGVVTIPLFFEIHRLSVFTPRSLDTDVVLDLMIHDLDIVLALVKQSPVEIRAAGISVLSPKVDIANVRLAFSTGCVANLTASRVSTERVRKLRLFQPGQYITVDYARQDAAALRVTQDGSAEIPKIDFAPLPIERREPLQEELAAFFQSVRERTPPLVGAEEAVQSLRVAEAITVKIKEHGDLVRDTVRTYC
ncbi:MAG TPA: Gfo/Idh/MocA family oxidoreductase [Bryobacteraceae bacterium]|nr:Gfo/Idh/MocA family oxidoreductase [Bryobacteraceae bacterium]